MIFSIGIFMHCIGLTIILSGLYIQYKQVEVNGFVAYYNAFDRMLDDEISLIEDRQDSLAPTFDSLNAILPMMCLRLDSLPYEEAIITSQEYMSALNFMDSELESQEESISRVKSLNYQQRINHCDIARYHAELTSLNGIHSRLQPLAWVFSILGIALYSIGYAGWRKWEINELDTKPQVRVSAYRLTRNNGTDIKGRTRRH